MDAVELGRAHEHFNTHKQEGTGGVCVHMQERQTVLKKNVSASTEILTAGISIFF